jgi:ABC-type uncharacterized transport system permease subunit
MTLNPITDLQLWQQMLLYAAPLIIAAMGELLIERSGILNVAIEGMMLVAAVVCFVVAWETGSSLPGIAAAMAASGLMALVLAYYGITLRGSQITVGLGLYVLGIGLSSLIYRVVFGVRLTPPRVATLGPLPIPGLAEIPVLGPILFQQNVLVYVALLLVPAHEVGGLEGMVALSVVAEDLDAVSARLRDSGTAMLSGAGELTVEPKSSHGVHLHISRFD